MVNLKNACVQTTRPVEEWLFPTAEVAGGVGVDPPPVRFLLLRPPPPAGLRFSFLAGRVVGRRGPSSLWPTSSAHPTCKKIVIDENGYIRLAKF